jgi:Domain of unknown function (DUF4351)
LLRLIDWLLVLPKGLEIAFREEMRTFEREKTMPHITSFERLSRQKGLQQGLQQGRQEGRQEAILDLLSVRFGEVPEPVVERVKALHEEAVLRRLPAGGGFPAIAGGLCGPIAQLSPKTPTADYPNLANAPPATCFN